MPRRRLWLAMLVAVIATCALPGSSRATAVSETNASAHQVLSATAASARFASGVVRPASIKATPSGKGLLVLGRDGTVHSFGDAPSLGSATLPHAAVTIAVTHSGAGYWVFDANGCAAQFGDAPQFSRSICAMTLNAPVLDAATTVDGAGYWLVASDGGIFAFGTAPFAGSIADRPLNRPVVGMAPVPDGSGYWEVASDGGVFAFNAPFRGSMAAVALNKPVIGMVASGTGYLMVGSDGGVFNFGNPFFGSLADGPPALPIVSIAPSFDRSGVPDGYWMLDASGVVYGFGNAWMPPAPSCTASVSNSAPARGAPETISYASNVAGASVLLTAHNKTNDDTFFGSTDSSGAGRVTFTTAASAPGFTVSVDVAITSGSLTAQCATAFTPS